VLFFNIFSSMSHSFAIHIYHLSTSS
jgi:hypothetical protein